MELAQQGSFLQGVLTVERGSAAKNKLSPETVILST